MKSFGRTGVVLAALAVGMLLSNGGAPVFADMISSNPVSEATSTQPAADRVALESQLQSMGLTPVETEQRLASLSTEEVSGLVGAPEQVQMAGNHLVIIGVGVVIVILAFWFIESYNQRDKNKA